MENSEAIAKLLFISIKNRATLEGVVAEFIASQPPSERIRRLIAHLDSPVGSKGGTTEMMAVVIHCVFLGTNPEEWDGILGELENYIELGIASHELVQGCIVGLLFGICWLVHSGRVLAETKIKLEERVIRFFLLTLFKMNVSYKDLPKIGGEASGWLTENVVGLQGVNPEFVKKVNRALSEEVLKQPDLSPCAAQVVSEFQFKQWNASDIVERARVLAGEAAIPASVST